MCKKREAAQKVCQFSVPKGVTQIFSLGNREEEGRSRGKTGRTPLQTNRRPPRNQGGNQNSRQKRGGEQGN